MSRGRAKRVLAGGGPRPALDLNFLAMGGNLPSIVSFSRASTGWYFNSAGLLVSAASGAPRFDYGLGGAVAPLGLLIEAQRTNLALYSRDATQAAWTTSNVTAAKNQTGIDGAANSASSLTASAADGTCLQSITQASTSDTFSVYLKRLTGTGEIDITLDGGSTWQNVTGSLSTTAWVRVSKNETVANSSFGIRIVTNGDAVAMDVAQIEAGPFATSPIITTSATVTRAGDVATIANGAFSWGYRASTFLAKFLVGAIQNVNPTIFGGSDLNGDYLLYSQGGGSSFGVSWGDGVDTLATSDTGAVGQISRAAVAWDASNVQMCINGRAVASLGSAPALTHFASQTSLGIGNIRAGNPTSAQIWIQRGIYYNRRQSAAFLQSMTNGAF